MHSLVAITNKLARRSFRRHENDTVVSYNRPWSMANGQGCSRPGSNQENIPPILKLPPEVFDLCWSFLTRSDLLRVCHVCRVFWYTSRSRIFRSFSIRFSHESLPGFRRCIGFLLRKTRTNTTFRILESLGIRLLGFYSDPSAHELWDMVQTCRLSVADTGRRKTSFDAIFLSRSRNLRCLVIFCMDLGREHCAALQSLPALETLTLFGCSFLSSSHFQRPLKLKELMIADRLSYHTIDNHLLYVLCNPAHLEKLILTDLGTTDIIYTILSGLLSMGQFPRLTYLNILVESRSRSHFFRFLGAIPSLTTLILRTSVRSGRVIPSHPLPALSSFQSYDGHPQLISHIVPGRPVETVRLVPKVSRDGQLCDGDTSSDFASVVLDISRSSVPVTTLRIQYFMPTLSRLATIADHLPDLHLLDLNLVPISPPHTLEDMNTPSDTSFDIYLDRYGDPLGRVDTVHYLLSWLAAGFAPLPPRLVTLRLTHYPEYYICGKLQPIEWVEQQETLCCLHGRYPSLRKVEIRSRHWWREGEHWYVDTEKT
ncbi:hypothetical protein M405DRAFT_935344 [Rhizopogon salebrosus TDB-379]|nr:hypothetical protein M405DRAFT_935344 [Rhizopogon salebrosus TDB-379]